MWYPGSLAQAWIQAAAWHSAGQRLELRPWIQIGELEGSNRRTKDERGGRPQHVCLLKTTIHFVHASSFYFDQELLQYENYSYTSETTIL
jgi:hypothetical protein